jgi:hypothetical protein
MYFENCRVEKQFVIDVMTKADHANCVTHHGWFSELTLFKKSG